MYNVIVRSGSDIIATSLLEGLAEAVSFGRGESSEGNSITIYDSVQDACGNIVHLNKVLFMIMPKENPYV